MSRQIDFANPSPQDYEWIARQPLQSRMALWQALEREYHRSIGFVRKFVTKKKDKYEWADHYDYIANFATVKPEDGDNAKLADGNERCLTCLAYNLRCHGSSVKGGRCETCNGMHGKDGKEKKPRVCFWLEPEKNVWTYPKAQEVHKSRTLFANTSQGRADRRQLEAQNTTSASGHNLRARSSTRYAEAAEESEEEEWLPSDDQDDISEDEDDADLADEDEEEEPEAESSIRTPRRAAEAAEAGPSPIRSTADPPQPDDAVRTTQPQVQHIMATFDIFQKDLLKDICQSMVRTSRVSADAMVNLQLICRGLTNWLAANSQGRAEAHPDRAAAIASVNELLARGTRMLQARVGVPAIEVHGAAQITARSI